MNIFILESAQMLCGLFLVKIKIKIKMGRYGCTLLNFQDYKFSGSDSLLKMIFVWFGLEHIHFVCMYDGRQLVVMLKMGKGALFFLWRKQMIYLNETTCSVDCASYAFLSLAMVLR